MKPYYEHGGITIYHGDCRDILPALSGVDAIVSDPPYGIGYAPTYCGTMGGAYPVAAKNYPPIHGDDKPFDPSHLFGFDSVLVWGANHYADKVPAERGTWLVWDKRCGIIPERHQADCELAWCSIDSPARMFRHYWDGMVKASEQGVPRVHPTQKPIALMKWCLGFFPKAQRICDPYIGGGTTLVAAKECGIEAIGIEIEEKYCEIAAKRLSQEVFQF